MLLTAAERVCQYVVRNSKLLLRDARAAREIIELSILSVERRNGSREIEDVAAFLARV
jgi:hypothetical protein